MEKQKVVLDITYESILRIVVAIATIMLVLYLKDVIFILFASIVLALIMDPAVDYLEKRKVPRTIGSLSLFFLALLVVAMVIYLIAPPLVKELRLLAARIPYFDGNLFYIDQRLFSTELSGPVQNVLMEISSYIREATTGFFSGVFTLLGGMVSTVLMIVISFYLVIEDKGIERFVQAVVPSGSQKRALRIIEEIQIKLGRWFIGQISLGFIVGSMSFIGLYLLGVPYALVLAIIAGVLELVPYVGPTLSAIPAIVIALTVSPKLAFLTLLLYFFVQQAENYLIVPKVMERSINLHPIITIIAIILGSKLAGISGAILALPAASIVSIILSDIYSTKKIES